MKRKLPMRLKPSRSTANRLRSLALGGALACFSGGALAVTVDELLADGCALTALMGTESGGATNIVNPHGTAAGRTQITLSTMVGLGAATCTTGRSGQCPVGSDAYGMGGIANRDRYATINPSFFQGLQVNSWQDVFTGPDALAAQQRMERAYFSSSLEGIRRAGLIDRFAGNSNNALGINMNNAAMLQCANAGVANCRSMLENGTSIAGPASEIRAAIARSSSRYNPSAGNCESGTLDNGNRDPSLAPDVNGPGTDGLYCDPEVLRIIQEQGAQEVDRRVSLAADANTGFSLLGGESVLEAAGLGTGSGGTGSSPTGSGSAPRTMIGSGSGSFRSLSCLDNLLGGGLSVIFRPPNFGAILSAIENAVCQQLNSLVSQATRPLQQAVYRNANLDSFLPGYGLGGLGGGVNVGTGGGQGGINVGYTNTLGGGAGGSIIGNTGQGYGYNGSWGNSLFQRTR